MFYYIIKKDRLQYKLSGYKEKTPWHLEQQLARSYCGTFTLGAFESKRVARAAQKKLQKNTHLDKESMKFTMDYRIVEREEVPEGTKVYKSTKDFVNDFVK